jgi:protein-L-isoaspartate(D-aspartate) O-methyltransferase
MKKKKNFKQEREKMVQAQIEARGIKDEKVLEAMRKVPRHLFVPENMRRYSYQDEPLPIGEGQTISQPYIVAYMSEALNLKGNEKVLEIGTGSGYQTAILAEIVKEVFSIEIVDILSSKARKVIKELRYENVCFKIEDGTQGWKEHAPYDAIIVTAAPSKVPQALKNQLKILGRMVIPVGSTFQELIHVIREKKKFKEQKLLPVRFVPLISKH